MIRIALVSYDINEGRVDRYAPLNLCTLATSLERAGYEVRVFDYSGPLASTADYFREIRDYRPGLIGLACFTPYVRLMHAVTTKLREALPGAAMLIGGYHPSVWPEWCLQQMPQFDYALMGECDRGIVQFAAMLDGKESPESVKGLVYRCNGDIRKNECDEIPDINALPETDRKFLDRYYRQGMYGYLTDPGPVDLMLTSRGCPFACAFCFKLERKYRFRNVESLMAEFETLRRRGVKSVHIMDDAFTAQRKRCIEIADALVRGNYRFRLKVRSRVDAASPELLQKLKQCGVRQIVYGLESGSQAVLDCMNKRATVQMNERAVQLTNQAGIFCTADIMVGMPAETPETIRETMAFLRRNRVIIGNVPYLYPLPGTQVYEDARKNGMLQGDWTIDGPDPWVKLPWTASLADLSAAARSVERAVHHNPKSIAYFFRHNWRVLARPAILRRILAIAGTPVKR